MQSPGLCWALLSTTEAFRQRSQEAVYGDPLLDTTTKGPIISSNQHAKILEHIQNGKASGARLLHGGNNLGETGYLVEDTAFADVNEDTSIMREEIFGPIASIAKFDTENEAIAKANDTEYGLAAAVFTENISRAHRVSAALESGMVTINCWGAPDSNTPFGGVKQSGFGRDQGVQALEGWASVKTVKMLLLSDKESS
ncbi:hypothetical protein MMC14_010335 [Varicellaria rhodocarpa]|nr:hypothetical protein [Varicellaria rhodocarpa]